METRPAGPFEWLSRRRSVVAPSLRRGVVLRVGIPPSFPACLDLDRLVERRCWINGRAVQVVVTFCDQGPYNRKRGPERGRDEHQRRCRWSRQAAALSALRSEQDRRKRSLPTVPL